MLKILKTNQPLLILKSALLLGGCLQGEDHGGRWVGGRQSVGITTPGGTLG